MKLDARLVSGILIGAVLGLHYHAYLAAYLPILTVATLIMLLRIVSR